MKNKKKPRIEKNKLNKTNKNPENRLRELRDIIKVNNICIKGISERKQKEKKADFF